MRKHYTYILLREAYSRTLPKEDFMAKVIYWFVLIVAMRYIVTDHSSADRWKVNLIIMGMIACVLGGILPLWYILVAYIIVEVFFD